MVTAEEVVRRFLASLLEGRFTKKSLAMAMGSSRSHLDEALKTGVLRSKNITGIAAANGTRVSAIFEELAGIARRLETAKRNSSR